MFFRVFFFLEAVRTFSEFRSSDFSSSSPEFVQSFLLRLVSFFRVRSFYRICLKFFFTAFLKFFHNSYLVFLRPKVLDKLFPSLSKTLIFFRGLPELFFLEIYIVFSYVLQSFFTGAPEAF